MNLAHLGARLQRIVRRIRKAYLLQMRPDRETFPVFVVGAHRCGTSMTLQAFHEGDYSVAYEQTNRQAFDGHMLRDDATIRSLLDRSHADVVAFKPLQQNQQVKRYLRVFPELRVVWLVRDYRAAAMSAAATWRSIRQSFTDYLAGRNTDDWRFDGLSPHQREIIDACFSPHLSRTDIYALFWYLRSSFYFEHGLDRDERVRLFVYEDLVGDAELEFRQMMEFCCCRFDARVYKHVRPSISHGGNDLELDSGIARLCQGLWERLIEHKKSTRKRSDEFDTTDPTVHRSWNLREQL